MHFSLTTLGIASATPQPDKFSSAHVVDFRGRLFAIDCGEGCQVLFKRYGFSPLKIENILISHLHGDHVFGIFGLLSSMALLGRTAPLYIYAPPRMEKILAFFMEQFGDGVQFDINFTPLKATDRELIFESRSLEIYAFPLNHKIATYGFLFKEKEPPLNVHKWKIEADSLTLSEIAAFKRGEDVLREDGDLLEAKDYTYIPYKGRTLAYCSDTAPLPERLAGWIDGVDLLYHEATYGEDMAENAAKYFHSTASDAARAAVACHAGRLVIGHFSARYRSHRPLLEQARAIFPDTALAREGARFEIEIKKLG